MLVLAIGIGVNNMFFMVVYAHALRGLPIRRRTRAVHLVLADRANDRPVSFLDFEE